MAHVKELHGPLWKEAGNDFMPGQLDLMARFYTYPDGDARAAHYGLATGSSQHLWLLEASCSEALVLRRQVNLAAVRRNAHKQQKYDKALECHRVAQGRGGIGLSGVAGGPGRHRQPSPRSGETSCEREQPVVTGRGRLNPARWRSNQRADLPAIPIGEAYGVAGADRSAHCIAVEEIARACASSSLIVAGPRGLLRCRRDEDPGVKGRFRLVGNTG